MKIPTLFLICGLPGSGKTTLAKQLEVDRQALRLTPDEWMNRIVEDGFNEEKRAIVESIQLEIAKRCLTLGINVILDFGFWSREERDTLKALAESIGARTELHYLNVSMEELLRRLNERNAALPEHTFHVAESQLRLWESWFEAPSQDELG